MKFGGTSVRDPICIQKVIEIVRESKQEHRVSVVVSAMAGVTDLLIEAAERSANGDSQRVCEILKALRERHDATANSLIRGANWKGLDRKMGQYFRQVQRICEETVRAGKISPQSHDFVASLGERLCAPMMAAALQQQGMASEGVDASECLITDSCHGSANPYLEATRKRCARRIQPILRAGAVPVVTGFIGATEEGTLTTLGRGGSDYSATVLAAALGAQQVTIWTDVDGVFTSDPRLVPQARIIPHLSYEQAATLARFGAKILHPKTLDPVVQRGIPVWVRNTFAPQGSGTKISLGEPSNDGVVALTALRDVSLVTITVSKTEDLTKLMHRTFSAVKSERVDVLLAWTRCLPPEFRMVVPSALAGRTINALNREFGESDKQEPVEKVVFENGIAVVTVVGHYLRDSSDTAERAYAAFRREGMRVVTTAEQTSRSDISFVVKLEEMEKTLRVLHKGLQLNGTNV